MVGHIFTSTFTALTSSFQITLTQNIYAICLCCHCDTHLLHFFVAWCARYPRLQDGRKVITEEGVHIVATHHGTHTLTGQELEMVLCVCAVWVCAVWV